MAHGAASDPPCAVATLFPVDGQLGDNFGQDVAVSDDHLLVGLPFDDDAGSASGTVRALRWDGRAWIQVQVLAAPDAAAGDRFGWSVAVDGDTALVGAYRDDDQGSDTGSVHVFRWEGGAWVHEQKLLPTQPVSYFGVEVDLSGDIAAITASTSSQKAYVFRRSGTVWSQEQMLVAPDTVAGDQFAVSIDVDGDAVVVGASNDGDLGSQSGSAHVFRWNGVSWAHEQKLLASDGTVSDFFGTAVGVAGEFVAVGAHGDDPEGSVSVFRFDGSSWLEVQKFSVAADQGGTFGSALAISGDRLVVGDWIGPAGVRGALWSYRWNGASWADEQLFTTPGAADHAKLGWSVATDGATIVGGAPDNKLGSTIMGSVEVVRFVCPSPLFADLNGDDSVDGADLGILLGAWGDIGGDLNDDGTTDGADLGMLLGAWTG